MIARRDKRQYYNHICKQTEDGSNKEYINENGSGHTYKKEKPSKDLKDLYSKEIRFQPQIIIKDTTDQIITNSNNIKQYQTNSVVKFCTIEMSTSKMAQKIFLGYKNLWYQKMNSGHYKVRKLQKLIEYLQKYSKEKHKSM